MLDLARRMPEVLYEHQEHGIEIVGAEQPFDVPLIDLGSSGFLLWNRRTARDIPCCTRSSASSSPWN